MIFAKKFSYIPSEHEVEKASNSYLMSLIALLAGLPIPIINLIATIVFYFGNRKGTYFVRWHCMQALLSQFSLLLMNSGFFCWTISIIFGNETLSNKYIAYVITILFFNIAELVGTIYTAIKVRKGIHVEWWFYGELTDLLCKQK
jgi:uncharacterized membrane protein